MNQNYEDSPPQKKSQNEQKTPTLSPLQESGQMIKFASFANFASRVTRGSKISFLEKLTGSRDIKAKYFPSRSKHSLEIQYSTKNREMTEIFTVEKVYARLGRISDIRMPLLKRSWRIIKRKCGCILDKQSECLPGDAKNVRRR